MGYIVLNIILAIIFFVLFLAYRSHLRSQVMREYENNRQGPSNGEILDITKRAAIGMGTFYGIVFFLMTMTASVFVINKGYVGIEHAGYRHTGNVYTSGIHISWPWTIVDNFIYKRTEITIKTSDKDDAALTKDQFYVFYNIQFPYSVNENMIIPIWQKIGYSDAITDRLKSHALAATKEVIAKYSLAELTPSYGKISDEIFAAFTAKATADFKGLGFTDEEAKSMFSFTKIDIVRLQPEEKILNALAAKELDRISKDK